MGKRISLSTVIGLALFAWLVLGAVNLATFLIFGWDFCLFTMTSVTYLAENRINLLYVLVIGIIFSAPLVAVILPGK